MSKLVLVTGANSFIGAWIVKYLVEQGYKVRGTVRSKEKEAQVLDGISNQYHDQISFVHVADIATDSFDEAIDGVDIIIHVASPFHFKIDDPEKDMLLPAINGTTSILKAAHKYNSEKQKKIQRVVITSSFAALFDPSKGYRPGYHYSEKDWCPLTYEQAVAAKNEPALVYRASKVCAERAVWEFLDKEKPTFTVATICPPMVFGPRVNGIKCSGDINTSNANIWRLINSSKDAPVPETRVPLEIDVRDVAFAHIAAIEKHTDRNERYLIVGGTWSNQAIVDIIHACEEVPEKVKNTTPIGNPNEKLPDHYTADTSKAQTELGVTYIPLKTTIEDLLSQLTEYKITLEQ